MGNIFSNNDEIKDNTKIEIVEELHAVLINDKKGIIKRKYNTTYTAHDRTYNKSIYILGVEFKCD